MVGAIGSTVEVVSVEDDDVVVDDDEDDDEDDEPLRDENDRAICVTYKCPPAPLGGANMETMLGQRSPYGHSALVEPALGVRRVEEEAPKCGRPRVAATRKGAPAGTGTPIA